MKKNNNLIMFIFLVLFLVEIVMFANSFSVSEQKSDVLYSYDSVPNGTYVVQLKPNDYTNSTTLGMSQMYISKLVSMINTKFNYQFKGSEIADLTYTYSVNADIIGNYQSTNEDNNKEIWKKSYSLVPSTTVNLKKQKEFSFEKEVPINFEQYNSIVENFYKEISVPMDAYLLVTFNVNVKSVPNSNVGSVNENSSFEIKIPLNEQAFQIKTNAKTNEKKTIDEVIQATSKVNLPLLLLSSTLIVVTLAAAVIYNKKYKPEKESEYVRNVKRILKDYGDIIVEINTLMDISKMSIIEVKSLNELIDLEAEIRIPILYYEKDKESWFMIVQGKQLYRFILKEESEVK